MGLPTIKIRANDVIIEAKLENLCGKAEPRAITYKGEPKALAMKPDGSPVIVRKDSKGNDVSFARLDKHTGKIVRECANVYIDSEGVVCEEPEHFYETVDGECIPAVKNIASGELNITSFMPESDFINDYLIDKYYQVIPYQGKSKVDKVKEVARASNVTAMKRLWDYLASERVVGKGQLTLSSAGWLPSVAFIRAIKKEYWTLEIGIAKQKKQFTWTEEHDFKLSPKEQTMLQHEEL